MGYNIFMEFILFLVGAIVGMTVASFTLIPILIIFRFGIPYTKQLGRTGDLIKNNNIVTRYLFSVMLLGGLYFMCFWGSGFFAQMLYSGYIFGTIGSLLIGFSKTGANPQNMSDYKETNKSKFI